MYLKITNTEENHHNLQYKDGLNVDPVPFNSNPKESCVPGGIYFTTPEFIYYYFSSGSWIREVTIPDNAKIVQDPSGDKWRANKVILSPRKALSEIDTWKWLVECGVNVHIENEALIFAIVRGYFEVIKYLIEECKVDVHFRSEHALMVSVLNNRLEIVKYLVEKCSADINANIWLLRLEQSESIKYLRDNIK